MSLVKREGVRSWRSGIRLLLGGLLSKNAYKVLTKKYFGNDKELAVTLTPCLFGGP